jgi:hypothetical protein
MARFREHSVGLGDFLKLPKGCGSLIPRSHHLIKGKAFPAPTANTAWSNLWIEPRVFGALSLQLHFDMYRKSECEHKSPFQFG